MIPPLRSTHPTVSWRRVSPLLVLLIWLLSACSPVLPSPQVEETTPQITRTRPAMPTLMQTNTPTPAYTPTPDPLVELRGLEMRLLYPWTGSLAAALQQAVDDFNQTNEWGIKVLAESSGSSMATAQRLETPPPEAVPPDLIIAPSEHLLYWHANGNRIRPLNDFLLDPRWGLSEARRADFPLVFWQQDQADGQQIGIPALRAPRVFFYNLTWASELGFNRPPESAADFKQHACAAAQANNTDRTGANDGSGGWMVDTDGWTIYAWLKSFGLNNSLQGEPAHLTFNQPQTLQAAEFLRGMVDEGCAFFGRIPPEEAFATRRALYFSSSLLDLPILAAAMQRSGSEDVWMALPFPTSDRPVVVVGGLSYAILRSQPERELAAWLFIRWMTQPEVQAALLQAGGGYPLGAASATLAQEAMRQKYPAWLPTLQWIPIAQPLPVSGEWRFARFILEDAFWQALQYYVPPDQLPAIINQIDPTLREVLEMHGVQTSP
ncbi:MAG: extracellular solute-binding protein [Chloroflexota bacterium]